MRPIVRPIHKGSVLADGVFADLRVLGEERARERLVRSMREGARVFRFDGLLVACLRAPVRMLSTASPVGLLVRQGEVLSSAPLEKDALNTVGREGAFVAIVAGGAIRSFPLDGQKQEDAASWIDVSSFETVTDVEPLGTEKKAPSQAVVPVSADVRGTLGVSEAPAEAREVENALRGEKQEAFRFGRSKSRVEVASGLLGSFFWSLGAVLERLLGPRVIEVSDGEAGRAAGGKQSVAVIRDAKEPSKGGLAESLYRRLQSLAIRFLLAAGLSKKLDRKQAEYIARMMAMFDDGDLDNALRHAVGLGRPLDGEGEPPMPALGAPSPRGALTIAPVRRRATRALYSEQDLLDQLKARYRAAFHELVRRGEIEKAAFVLSELLGSDEEAALFLEKHGRPKLAAEVAEARNLSPGLIVRLWFLAGDIARAVRIARAFGAFSDAIRRLEQTGHKKEADALRLHYADALARAGQYMAAVRAVWNVEGARTIARKWMDLAIEVGGPSAAQVAIRKAIWFEAAFGEARDCVLALIGEEGEDGLSCARAAASELLTNPKPDASRVLSTPVLRRLFRSEEPEDRTLAEKLLDAAGDPVLAADVRALKTKASMPARRMASRGRSAGLVKRISAVSTVDVRRSALDAGTMPVFDAVLLPDGRILAALGDGGAVLLSKTGRAQMRFSEPASKIVLSDEGDRALLLAERGGSTRLARLDLVGRRKQAWCDVYCLDAYSEGFDGSVWFVSVGGVLYSIDVTQQGWEHLWSFAEKNLSIQDIFRSETALTAVAVDVWDRTVVDLTFELPGMTLRGRKMHKRGTVRDLDDLFKPEERGFLDEELWWADTEERQTPLEVTLSLRHKTEQMPCLRVRMGGARSVGHRVSGERLVVFDDLGRILLISLRTGAVLREMRL